MRKHFGELRVCRSHIFSPLEHHNDGAVFFSLKEKGLIFLGKVFARKKGTFPFDRRKGIVILCDLAK